MQLGRPRDRAASARASGPRAHPAIITLEHVRIVENSPRARTPGGLNCAPVCYAICSARFQIFLQRTRTVLLHKRDKPPLESSPFAGCVKSLRSNNRIPLCCCARARERAGPVTPGCNKYYNNRRDSARPCEQREKPYLRSSAIFTAAARARARVQSAARPFYDARLMELITVSVVIVIHANRYYISALALSLLCTLRVRDVRDTRYREFYLCNRWHVFTYYAAKCERKIREL